MPTQQEQIDSAHVDLGCLTFLFGLAGSSFVLWAGWMHARVESVEKATGIEPPTFLEHTLRR